MPWRLGRRDLLGRLLLLSVDRAGLVNRRRIDFQNFYIVGTFEFVMDDAGRLQYAIALAEGLFFALAVINKCYPAFQYIHHLEVQQMLMEAGCVQIVIAIAVLFDPDYMGAELAIGRVLDTQVAVFHNGRLEFPNAGFEDRPFGAVNGEFLFLLPHALVVPFPSHAGVGNRAHLGS
jgi:hypothetical protein